MVATAGSGWRLAPCLIALIQECDRLYPSRSIASDGSIGDQAHATRSSDHNPSNGWVCAVDVTDDKAHGCDADLLASHLVASRDPRVKYVIWNGTVVKSYQSSNGVPAWHPQPYTGVNAHEKHTHVSVHNTADARNDVRPWWPTTQEDDMPLTVEDLNAIQNAVLDLFRSDGRVNEIIEQQVKDAMTPKTGTAIPFGADEIGDVPVYTYEAVQRVEQAMYALGLAVADLDGIDGASLRADLAPLIELAKKLGQ